MTIATTKATTIRTLMIVMIMMILTIAGVMSVAVVTATTSAVSDCQRRQTADCRQLLLAGSSPPGWTVAGDGNRD
jgi:uncharacterized membrane protein YqjE